MRRTAAQPNPAIDGTEIPPEPKGERTRKRILLRAADLFASKGYEGTGLQEIAKIAGVTKGSLYWHFKDKRHLYTEAACSVIETAFQIDKIPTPGETAVAGLRGYLSWLLPVLQNNSLARRLLLHMIIDQDLDLMNRLLKGSLGKSLDIFMGILDGMPLEKDKTVLAYFFYAICILNDELAAFADNWIPNLDGKISEIKTGRYLEALIKSW